MTTQRSYEAIPIEHNLTLRQLQPEDDKELFRLVDGDRTYLTQWLYWVDATKQPSDSEKFIRSTLKNRKEGAAYAYGIILDGNIVGHIELMHLKDDKEPEIGYWIASQAAGRGIATKATQSLTRFGTETLGMKRIIIKADPDNAASNRVAERAGYTLSDQVLDDEVGRMANIWAMNS